MLRGRGFRRLQADGRIFAQTNFSNGDRRCCCYCCLLSAENSGIGFGFDDVVGSFITGIFVRFGFDFVRFDFDAVDIRVEDVVVVGKAIAYHLVRNRLEDPLLVLEVRPFDAVALMQVNRVPRFSVEQVPPVFAELLKDLHSYSI